MYVARDNHRNRHESIGDTTVNVPFSNHGPISYRFRVNGDFSRKSQISSTPVYLTPRWRSFPWNWVTAFGLKRTNGAIWPRKKFNGIISRLDTINELDGETDGQTQTDCKYCAYA